MTELIEDQIRYRFARIPGVAQVDLWGGYNREVRIELDPERIKAAGLPLDQVIDAIEDANLDLPPARSSRDATRSPCGRRPSSPAWTRSGTRSSCSGGGRRRLGQVADVRDTYEKKTRIVRVNGKRGLYVGIRKQANANTVEVSRRVLEEIEAINQAFPQITVVPVINQGNLIERSIANVARSVLYGGGLAVVVLLFFLRSIRSTLVISLSIPISIIATFALIYFGGFTLNLMTLGGLALGVGMMVDSSIVVLENIFRRRSENGLTPEEASVEGAQEVGTGHYRQHHHHAGHFPAPDLRARRGGHSLQGIGLCDHLLAGLLPAGLVPQPGPHAGLPPADLRNPLLPQTRRGWIGPFGRPRPAPPVFRARSGLPASARRALAIVLATVAAAAALLGAACCSCP
jgi:hypothetical protein